MNPILEIKWFIRRVRRRVFWWNFNRQKVKAHQLLQEKLREDRQKFLVRSAKQGSIIFYRGNRPWSKQ